MSHDLRYVGCRLGDKEMSLLAPFLEKCIGLKTVNVSSARTTSHGLHLIYTIHRKWDFFGWYLFAGERTCQVQTFESSKHFRYAHCSPSVNDMLTVDQVILSKLMELKLLHHLYLNSSRLKTSICEVPSCRGCCHQLTLYVACTVKSSGEAPCLNGMFKTNSPAV